MLSIWKLRVGAESYYLGSVARGLDDYYAGAGEMPGEWLGTASSGFGLGGMVVGDELQAVLAGLVPGTGLSPNGDQVRSWKGRVPGFDLTFSAPKSVSVLYALGDPLVRAELVEAHTAAIGEALGWLERESCFVRRGSNDRSVYGAAAGTQRLRGAGFVAAAFRHRTSRAGDPQLHSHVLIANQTRGPDGRWSALDGQPLYRSIRAAGTMYQTVLRAELTARLGVDWGPVRNDQADVAGVPQAVLKLFSKRRGEIEAELERTGKSGPAAAQEAALATRANNETLDGETLDARWRDEAAQIGYTPESVDQLLTHTSHSSQRTGVQVDPFDPGGAVLVLLPHRGTGELVETSVQIEDFAGQIADALLVRDGIFTRHQVQSEVASQLRSGASAATVDRLTAAVLAQPSMVELPGDHPAAGFEQQ